MYYWFEFIACMMQYNLTEPEVQYISFVRIISRFQTHCLLGNFVGFCCFGWKIDFLSTVMGLYYLQMNISISNRDDCVYGTHPHSCSIQVMYSNLQISNRRARYSSVTV
jgi:hypothetical protein